MSGAADQPRKPLEREVQDAGQLGAHDQIALLLADLEGLLRRAGILERIGPDRVFDTAEEALVAYREWRATAP